MAKRELLLWVGILCLVDLSSPAAADVLRPGAPMEMAAFQSDKIAVVEVIQADDPVEKEIVLPDGRARYWWFTQYKLAVSKVIKGAGQDLAAGVSGPPSTGPAPAKGPAPGTTLSAIAVTSPEAIVATNPRAKSSHNYHGHPMDDKVHWENVYHAMPDLKAGQSCVVFLKRLPAANEYYVLAVTPVGKNEDSVVAAVRKAADTDQWNWSRETGGLQLAMIVPANQSEGSTTDVGQVLPAVVVMGFALRNRSDKTVAVNLCPEDRFLSVTAVGPGRWVIRDDFHGGAKQPAEVQFDAKTDAVTLKPGEIIFVGPEGKTDDAVVAYLDLRKGKWTFTGAYESRRRDRAADGTPLWTGKLDSAAVEVQVAGSSSGR